MPSKKTQSPGVANALTEEEIEEWFEQEEDEDDEPSGQTIPSELSEESIERKYAESQLRIVRTSHDFTLHTLREMLKDSTYINMAPAYQRRNRWDRKRRSQLIESFVMNIPVPPIFLFEDHYNQYEVMDGRQRLSTIRDYLDNRFPLSGLEFWTELKGKRFSELSTTLQKGLLRRSISAIVLLAETTRPGESSIDVRMVLFRRLNTGGARLNPQELRNALYPGSFNDMLLKLSRDSTFTYVWGIPAVTPDETDNPPLPLLNNALYRTMADCELVLRFFAIRETIELNLKGSLTRLLDGCMVRHLEDGVSQIRRQSDLFLACIRSLSETFADQAFVLPTTGRPSRPLYDALMVALSLHPGFRPVQQRAEIKARLTQALNEPQTYDVLTGRGNTIEAIKERVRKAEELLLGAGGQ